MFEVHLVATKTLDVPGHANKFIFITCNSLRTRYQVVRGCQFKSIKFIWEACGGFLLPVELGILLLDLGGQLTGICWVVGARPGSHTGVLQGAVVWAVDTRLLDGQALSLLI